jgi:hypothetical protein
MTGTPGTSNTLPGGGPSAAGSSGDGNHAGAGYPSDGGAGSGGAVGGNSGTNNGADGTGLDSGGGGYGSDVNAGSGGRPGAAGGGALDSADGGTNPIAGNGGGGRIVIRALLGDITSATGGTHTSDATYDYWTFDSSGTWTPTFTAGSGTVNRIAKFVTSTTLGNSLFSDDGSNMTLTSGNLLMQIGALIDTVASGALNFGTTNATTLNFGRSGQNAIFNGNVGIGTSTPGSLFSIQGIANFTTATSTLYGNGINLTKGCFAINGVCVGGGTATSSSGVSSIAQNYGTAQTGAISFATTSNSFNGLTVGHQITNSGTTFTFTPFLSGILGVGGGGTGASSLSGLLQGNGASSTTGVTGTIGQIPYYNGTNTLAATSSISIAARGQVSIGTTTASKTLNLGNDNSTANSSSTIMMGKIQFDGYNSAGVRMCMFLNSKNAFATSSGACK